MDDATTLIVVWLVLAAIPAWIATTQGRSPLAWFGISVLLSPVVGFLGVILTAPRRT